MYASLEEAISRHSNYEELFVIGGGQLYAEALPIAQKIYLTRVLKTFEGDTYFPEIDEEEWNTLDTRLSDDKNLWYEFKILERKII